MAKGRESATRYEHPDTTPVDVPFGFTYESLAETIGRMVRVENAKQAAKTEYIESFEESQDFGEEADEFVSKHEMTEMQDDMPSGWLNEEPDDPPEGALEPAPLPDPPAVDAGAPAPAPAAPAPP